jgi:hypothetical protein
VTSWCGEFRAGCTIGSGPFDSQEDYISWIRSLSIQEVRSYFRIARRRSKAQVMSSLTGRWFSLKLCAEGSEFKLQLAEVQLSARMRSHGPQIRGARP